MFCWTCKHISPPGSIYCAYCPGKKAFNAIICGGGHRCRIGMKSCPICPSDDFSDHTLGIPVGWIAKGIALTLVIFLARVGFAHGSSLLSAVWVGASYAFGFVTHSNASALGFVANAALAYGLTAWIVGFLLLTVPGQGGGIGKFLREWPLHLLLRTFDALPRLALALGRALLRLLGMTRRPPGPDHRKNEKP
jgi:RNA polymerase subunit RPABC4/transcription elongation factor Spt4